MILCHLNFWFVSPVNWSPLGSDTCKPSRRFIASLTVRVFVLISISVQHVLFYSLTLIPISKVRTSQRQVHKLEREDAVTQQASALVDSDLLPRGRIHVSCPGHGIADNG
ncbi:hypothetical protein O3P69_018668 [Scylla paramamosain]|uniref:Uncharacterized protein n=1 Tax=Scylla paramamosain TaxID=85552 RepID=A0AAW0SGX9_SCYPA